MTPRGFYSVVAHPDDPSLVLVRARARGDLLALTDLLAGLEIRETPERDYRWRTIVSRRSWSADRPSPASFRQTFSSPTIVSVTDYVRSARPAPTPALGM
jgi:hypothetical protein